MYIALKGHIISSKNQKELEVTQNGYIICENGTIIGVYPELPQKYKNIQVTDYTDKIIIPGMTDLHVHAPQYAFRSLGMDLELLDWLNTYTFKEEEKYRDKNYAEKAYSIFVDALKNSSTTRACVFATIHNDSTLMLMDMLENSGIISMVGKVNMDRNSPDYLCEDENAINNTKLWLEHTEKYKKCQPILTPRFTPSCTDKLMHELGTLQKQTGLPVQSHVNENKSEINWVHELCPWAENYVDTYDKTGLLNDNTVLAHGVYCNDKEVERLKQTGCYLAHCPQSNTNLSSGIAPIRRYIKAGLNIGLGSDVAGGANLSIFRAITDAIAVSKLNWCVVNNDEKPLTFAEAFWLATVGGGSFFGKVGKLCESYEFDALILDDSSLQSSYPMTPIKRLERIAYQLEDNAIIAKYVKGEKIK